MNPTFLLVDLFAGCGGTTIGYDQAEYDAEKIALIIAAVNHDPVQITSHWANHKNVRHFEEDIRTLDVRPLAALVQQYRMMFPNAKLILWASLECTNFSKAKGGQSRDADSRTLADHLFRYIEAIDPDYVKIENVVEFMAWGPMRIKAKKLFKSHTELTVVKDKKTKELNYGWTPISSKKGEDYVRWRKQVCDMGYHEEWRQMNSANYGAYTSRNRLFGCFAKHGLPIIFPENTHAKNGKGGKIQWNAVKEKLDFEDEGVSIFNRIKKIRKISQARRLLSSGKKCKIIYLLPTPMVEGYVPVTLEKKDLKKMDAILLEFHKKHPRFSMYYYDDLVEASLKRILAGLIKYVAGGMDGFIMKYNSFKNGVHHVPSFNDSCPTIAVQNRLGACFISRFMLQRNSGKPKGRVFSIDSPARTLTATGGNLELVQCFLTKYYSTGTHNHQSIEDPAGAIGVKDTFGKIWLDKTFGGDRNHSSIDQPAGSITGNPHDRIMNAQWIDRNFRAGGQHSSMDEPVGAILQVPKLNLVSAEPFIMTTNYRGIFTSMNEPSPPLLASRRHHLIINPSHGGYCTSAEAPGPVIIARQDKAPLSLLEVIEGECYIPIYDDDSDTMIDIKVFMSIFGIKDIKMRMLKVLELLKIQGFPEDYILMGNQTEQKKGIGNSVAPAVPEHWAIAMHVGLTQHREAA